MMKKRIVSWFALFAAFTAAAPAQTVIKVLHIQSLQAIRDIWRTAADEYEKSHPGVKVQFDYLENEAFKAKLPTLLQSSDRPSVFHSWGGGVMKEQVQADVCQDITGRITGEFKDSFYPAGIQNFTVDGKLYGLPNDVAPIVFWYNKELCQKAGVDPTKIKQWDDFLEAVKKLKAAGVTPISAGGGDKWPLHFYPTFLMMRIMGKSGLEGAISKDSKEGLATPDVLKAWKMYKDLCDLQPFQNGYQTAKFQDAGGFFHDGKAAFHLMGTWDLTEGRANSTSKKGLSNDQMGWIFFPEVKDGKGKANDIFASVDGWLLTKQAPKETVDFFKVWLGKETQTKLAAAGLFIPMVKGTAASIQDPFLRAIAQETEKADWIAIAMDQFLGPDTGRVFNDEAAAVAAGGTTPEQAVKAIQDSWSQNKM
jgi:raffinose/stachyose/melibiose transport system substrate-binding protein